PATRSSCALHFSCAKHISNLVEVIAMPRAQELCVGFGFEIFQGKPGYVALAFVAQQSRCFLQRSPESALHFDSHLWDDVVDAAGMVTQQIEADDLEYPLALAPGAHVHVLDIGQLGDGNRGYAGLFADLPQGGFQWGV